jgi:hypothetical protein
LGTGVVLHKVFCGSGLRRVRRCRLACERHLFWAPGPPRLSLAPRTGISEPTTVKRFPSPAAAAATLSATAHFGRFGRRKSLGCMAFGIVLHFSRICRYREGTNRPVQFGPGWVPLYHGLVRADARRAARDRLVKQQPVFPGGEPRSATSSQIQVYTIGNRDAIQETGPRDATRDRR